MNFELGFGGARKDIVRLPLRQALRLYWKHLVPFAILPTIVIALIGLTQAAWSFWAILPFFYGCGFYAMIPHTRKNAPYSFWIVACVLWVLGAFPGMLIFAGLKAIFQR